MTTLGINSLKLKIFISSLLLLSCIAFQSFYGNSLSMEQNEINTSVSFTSQTENNVSIRDRIVNFGIQLLDTPYVTAGTSEKGFDCSGFVYYVFKHFKIDVPRSSPQYEHFGKEIPIEKVQKGDVLVFISPTSNSIGHIGIVTNPKGMQSEFIHSTSGRQMKVIISSLKTVGYKLRFVKAVSVFK